MVDTMMDKQDLLNQRQTDISFTTSLFKAYKNSYSESEVIEISIPPSRQMIDLSQIQVYFRPVVKYQAFGDMTQFQNSQRCLTAIDAANHLTIDSITINNNQILAQPRQNQFYARTILDQYIKRFLKTKPVKGLSSDGIQLTTSYMMQAGSAMNSYNILENSIQVPAAGLYTHPNMTQQEEFKKTSAEPNNKGGLLVGTEVNVRDRFQNSSNFEGDYRPKAVVSSMYNYFYHCNIPPSDKPKAFGTSYYEQSSGVNISNPRTDADGVGSEINANPDLMTFPFLARCITPSISVYKRQQESFLAYRQRFIQIQAGPYKDDQQKQAFGSKTIMVDQYQGLIKIEDSDTNKGFGAVLGPDNGSKGEAVKTLKGEEGQTVGLRAAAGKVTDTRFAYGIPVQQSQDTSRYSGTSWAQTPGTSSKFLNEERLTTVSIKLGEISQELSQIGMLCMEKSRVDISLYVNRAECCLSAYLQPSLILDSLNSHGSVADLAINNSLNGGAGTTFKDAQVIDQPVQYYKKFLDLCQIGNSVSVTLNDLMLRVETHNYSMNAYQMVKEILYQPKAYSTFRFANKLISGSGAMSVQLNLGVSSTVRAVMYFILPRDTKFTAAKVKRSQYIDNALPQDAMVDYVGCQPPARGDCRSTILDSYYIPHESYVNIDNERYNTTQIPLADPQLNQYLLTSSALETAFGRYIDLDLQSFIHNRYFGLIPIDPTGSRKFISQMLDFNIIFDDKDRVNHSRTFNLHGRSIDNLFELVVVGVVGQTVVECQRVIV